MFEIAKLIHLVAAIIWMGGMTFMLFALRPAALASMEPRPRARLMGQVWQRFFPLVWLSILALLSTGSHLYTVVFRATKAAMGSGSVPLGWNLMLVFGVLMMLVFAHIYFAGYRRFKRAVAAEEWPMAAKAATQIQSLIWFNFALGWAAIVAVRLIR